MTGHSTAESPLRRAAFAGGSAAVTAGVILHLPMFFGAADQGYVLSGMPLDPLMVLGMALIGVGLAAVVFGLSPTREQRRRRVRRAISVGALDETHLGWPHLGLLAILVAGIAIDTQKPFTFTFILPGVAHEYGLASPGHPAPGHLSVALYPFSGIVGTVLGSLLWGYIGDRLGRRTAILLAAILFVATSICGAMPLYSLNLAMCFVMGLGAGGLLPIAYALLAEIIPARRRGQLVVLVAGVGTGLGFLLTSALASWTIPHFGWRIMWFFGLPTGLLLIVLNQLIPESPRFLLENGRVEEAEAIMRRFGAAVSTLDAPRTETGPLGRRPLAGPTLAIVLYGLGWGIVNFGFLTWLPTSVAAHGLGVAQASGILTNAALFSLPGAVLVSWLYHRTAKGTVVLVAASTATSLVAFATVGEEIAARPLAFTLLLVCLLISLWGVISVLAPYSAEVYPTALRARGAGLAAGASKFGGVIALGMGVAGVAPPGVTGSAILTGAVMAIAALAMAVFGIETRRQPLERIGIVEAPLAAG